MVLGERFWRAGVTSISFVPLQGTPMPVAPSCQPVQHCEGLPACLPGSVQRREQQQPRSADLCHPCWFMSACPSIFALPPLFFRVCTPNPKP